MVDSVSRRMHRSATREKPGRIFRNLHDLREPVFLTTLQPRCHLTVAEIVGYVFHAGIMHTTRPLVNDPACGSVALARERGAETPFDGRRHKPDLEGDVSPTCCDL